MKKPYELLEHTADVGIRVRSLTMEGLFRKAALAMFDIIAEERPLAQGAPPAARYRISVTAARPDELLVRWLNELLSLAAVEEKVFCGFAFQSLEEKRLEAWAEARDAACYRINTELKAATYHGLKLKKSLLWWQAEVIFDV